MNQLKTGIVIGIGISAFFILASYALKHGVKELANPSDFIQNEDSVSSMKAKQGNWKCVDIICDKACETCCEELIYFDLQIISDSVSYFQYPHQYYFTNSINETTSWLSHDTLSIKTLGATFLFIQQTKVIDSKTISLLKKDSINPASLVGTWELYTWKKMGYEGEEDYEGTIDFPFKLKSFLKLKATQLIPPLLIGRTLKIPVNGVNKACTIVLLTENHITFRAGNWDKDHFEFAYNRKE